MNRCFDCFHDFGADEPRFVVLKKMRDVPDDWRGEDMARSMAESLCLDQVFLCADCAGWYGDHPIGPLTPDEALGV